MQVECECCMVSFDVAGVVFLGMEVLSRQVYMALWDEEKVKKNTIHNCVL